MCSGAVAGARPSAGGAGAGRRPAVATRGCHQEVSDSRSSRTWAGVGTRPESTSFSSTTSAGGGHDAVAGDGGVVGDLLDGGVDAELVDGLRG